LGSPPGDEVRRWLQAQALQLTGAMEQTRWLLAQ
jgi:hypothetical protein